MARRVAGDKSLKESQPRQKIRGSRRTTDDRDVCLLVPSAASQLADDFRLQINGIDESPAIWIFGADAQCGNVNRRWLEFRGRALEQELHAGWTEGVHPADLKKVITAYRSAAETGRTFEVSFRCRRGDDSYVWVRANGTPKFLMIGKLAGCPSALIEINTADSDNASKDSNSKASSLPYLPIPGKRGRRLDVEEALQRIAGSGVPVVVIDARGHAVYCNDAFRLLAGKATSRGASTGTECATEVQTWLGSIVGFRNMRISADPITVGTERMTAFSILGTVEASVDGSLGRAFLHDLLNAVGGVQLLIDLLLEGGNRKERIEYVKLLQNSMNRLLADIDRQAMTPHDTLALQSVCSVRDVLQELADRHGSDPRAGTRISCAANMLESGTALCDRTLLIGVLDTLMQTVLEETKGGGVALECRCANDVFEFRVKHSSSPNRSGKRTGTRGAKFLNERGKCYSVISSDAILPIHRPAGSATEFGTSRSVSHEKKYAG